MEIPKILDRKYRFKTLSRSCNDLKVLSLFSIWLLSSKICKLRRHINNDFFIQVIKQKEHEQFVKLVSRIKKARKYQSRHKKKYDGKLEDIESFYTTISKIKLKKKRLFLWNNKNHKWDSFVERLEYNLDIYLCYGYLLGQCVDTSTSSLRI